MAYHVSNCNSTHGQMIWIETSTLSTQSANFAGNGTASGCPHNLNRATRGTQHANPLRSHPTTIIIDVAYFHEVGKAKIPFSLPGGIVNSLHHRSPHNTAKNWCPPFRVRMHQRMTLWTQRDQVMRNVLTTLRTQGDVVQVCASCSASTTAELVTLTNSQPHRCWDVRLLLALIRSGFRSLNTRRCVHLLQTGFRTNPTKTNLPVHVASMKVLPALATTHLIQGLHQERTSPCKGRGSNGHPVHLQQDEQRHA